MGEARVAEVPQPRRIRISTPGNWISVDAELIRAAADRLANGQPELRRAFEHLRLAADAFESSGVLFASFLVAPPRSEAIATMASYLIPRSIDDIQQLEADVTANPPADALEKSWSTEIVELPSGRAVRTECLRPTAVALPTLEAVSLSVQYLLALEGGTSVLVTNFTSPNVEQGDEYRELFASIAASMEMV